jgi:hypothetical protein
MNKFYRPLLIELFAAISLIVSALGIAPTCVCAPRDSDIAAAGSRIRIALVGDSTVTDEEGWGVGFKKCLAKNVECHNMSRGGRSSHRPSQLPDSVAKMLKTRAQSIGVVVVQYVVRFHAIPNYESVALRDVF